jgi:cell division transport system ATP-binding protein
LISLVNVTKIYPGADRPALDNVSLEVEAGEFVFLVGPSGSGKTTLIRLMLKEVTPTSGEIVVAGVNLNELRSWKVPYLRRNIGCVFQDFKLLPNKTAFENIAFALEVLGRPRRFIYDQVFEVLKLVGLEHKADSFPGELSGGEQQRISIARAIVNHPPVLIADEPTGNLDPSTATELMGLFDRINKTGTTVLIATHNKEMVDTMRKRVVALENGKIVRDQVRGVYGDEV